MLAVGINEMSLAKRTRPFQDLHYGIRRRNQLNHVLLRTQQNGDEGTARKELTRVCVSQETRSTFGPSPPSWLLRRTAYIKPRIRSIRKDPQRSVAGNRFCIGACRVFELTVVTISSQLGQCSP